MVLFVLLIAGVSGQCLPSLMGKTGGKIKQSELVLCNKPELTGICEDYRLVSFVLSASTSFAEFKGDSVFTSQQRSVLQSLSLATLYLLKTSG